MRTVEKKWCVYIHRNMINNKAYIGITCQNIEKRWGKNGHCYTENNQSVFCYAIKKYGWDNFEHIVWADNLSEREAKQWEIRLIALFKTNCKKYKNPEYGYNMTDGGDGSSGREMSEETKRKIGNSNKGKIPSAETRNKISMSLKGRILTEEHKRKISETHKGMTHSEESLYKMAEWQIGSKSPKARKIIQYDLDCNYIKEWECIKDASDELGIPRTGINRCCQKDKWYKQSGGFIWRYIEEPLTKEEIIKIQADKNHIQGVYQEKNGKWFAKIRNKRLGTFNTKEEAIAARMQAQKSK